MKETEFTHFIINCQKASKGQLDKMDIQAVAEKYHSAPEDIRFWRDHYLGVRG